MNEPWNSTRYTTKMSGDEYNSDQEERNEKRQQKMRELIVQTRERRRAGAIDYQRVVEKQKKPSPTKKFCNASTHGVR